ncbi:hypothetical protein ACWGDE_04860 [Streptomyces sp. NPDC054956]
MEQDAPFVRDVVDARIVYVEILDRPPMLWASPEPAARAEGEHPGL